MFCIIFWSPETRLATSSQNNFEPAKNVEQQVCIKCFDTLLPKQVRQQVCIILGPDTLPQQVRTMCCGLPKHIWPQVCTKFFRTDDTSVFATKNKVFQLSVSRPVRSKAPHTNAACWRTTHRLSVEGSATEVSVAVDQHRVVRGDEMHHSGFHPWALVVLVACTTISGLVLLVGVCPLIRGQVVHGGSGKVKWADPCTNERGVYPTWHYACHWPG